MKSFYTWILILLTSLFIGGGTSYAVSSVKGANNSTELFSSWEKESFQNNIPTSPIFEKKGHSEHDIQLIETEIEEKEEEGKKKIAESSYLEYSHARSSKEITTGSEFNSGYTLPKHNCTIDRQYQKLHLFLSILII